MAFFFLCVRRNLPGIFIADDTGMGKTLQTLATFAQLKSRIGSTFRSMVVVSKMTVDTWTLENSKFLRLIMHKAPQISRIEKVCQKTN